MIEIAGRYYLIGSIREDVKVRYWVADDPMGPFGNFFDNTLLPQGNYAARPSRDGDKCLVWCFFSKPVTTGGPQQLLPPPKELEVVDDGRLRLRSFHGFDKLVSEALDIDDLTPVDPMLGQLDAEDEVRGGRCWMGSPHGFEAFLFHGEFNDFRMRTKLELRGRGKCGLVFRTDDEGHGYYISMDMIKGLVQLRAWGEARSLLSRQAFSFRPLQSAHFISDRVGPWELRLIAYGPYLEFSVNDYVLLSLVDDTFNKGRVGFYCESAEILLQAPIIEELFRLYATGNWSLSDLARYAAAQGMTTVPMRRRRTREEMLADEPPEIEKTARPLTENHISRILTNPFYTGRTIGEDGTYIQSTSHSALVDDHTFTL
ncbi:MAG: recombinase family protein, partial [Firmicutes bacterium]|nr:recombinase family protein [Bacillota bacterium]